MIITLFVVWYLVGFSGIIWIETQTDDVRLSKLPILLLFSLVGPFAWVIAGDLYGPKLSALNPVIFEKVKK